MRRDLLKLLPVAIFGFYKLLCVEGLELDDESGSYSGSETHIPDLYRIYCPGLGQDYCNCEYDCVNHPEFCECEEAQACCESTGPGSSADGHTSVEDSAESTDNAISNSVLVVKGIADIVDNLNDNSAPRVVCPDKERGQYCDCAWDCENRSELCECEEAQACCESTGPGSYSGSETHIPDATRIYCPGLGQDYCNCEYDCENHPEFCECEEAQACCSESTDNAIPNSVLVVKGIADIVDNINDNIPRVVCPDKEPGEYCDCAWDCENRSELCECEEAQACCESTGPGSYSGSETHIPDATRIYCPGLGQDYCNCEYDCENHPEFCECEEAQACCSESTDNAIPNSVLVVKGIADIVDNLIDNSFGTPPPTPAPTVDEKDNAIDDVVDSITDTISNIMNP